MADQVISLSRFWRLSVAEGPAFMATQAGQALRDVVVQSEQSQDELEFVFGNELTQKGGWGAKKGNAWASSAPVPVTFSSTFQSTHNGDNHIIGIEQNLELLATKVPALGRSPICLFQWAHRSWRVYVKSVSCKHEGTYATGLPRRLTASITLEEVVDRPLDPSRQGDQPSTSYHQLQATETPAHLALYYLGDPTLGVLVRRDPANVSLSWIEMDRARVLPRANSFMRQPVRPAAPCFAAGWEEIAETVAMLRGDG